MYKAGLDISALDVNFKSHALRGIGRYVSELKKYFDSHQRKNLEVGYFDHREFKGGSVISSMVNLLPAGRQTVRQQVVYPLHLGKQKKRFDILHFPAHMDAPSWSVNNYVLTVLDLIPLVMSEMYKANKSGLRFAFARWLEIKSIKNADLILAISQNTANDVNRILGIPHEKIIVTPLGVDPRFFRSIDKQAEEQLRAKYKIPFNRQIVISVGGIDPRKNYVSLIESFSRLVNICREKNHESPLLLIVGSINKDRQYPHLQSLIKERDLADFIVETGYADDVDLPALYAISTVLFFPSLYEGFGLTPLEALAAGTAVVCSNTSCMPEVLGEAAIFSDPEDYEGCALKLFEVLHNADLRNEYKEKGVKRAGLFTWEKTGELTLGAYERLLENSKRSIAINI